MPQNTAKKLVFASVLVALPALLIVVLAEGILRLAGFGYATTPLIRAKIEGTDYWIGNPDFTRLYFPAALKRLPPPNRIPVEKASATRRYMIVGGSAAAGDPDADYSLARILEWVLSSAHPENGWEVINLAYTACNSHVAAEVVRQSEPYNLDGLVVLVGNNEVIGPFGPGTTLTEALPTPARRNLTIALRRTRLGQLGQMLREGMNMDRGEPETWRGMQHFLEHQIEAGDPRMEQVRANFKANLESLEQEARRQGIPAVLSDVPVNLLDHPPFQDNFQAIPEVVRKAIPGYLATGKTALGADDMIAFAEEHPGSAWVAYLAGRRLHDTGRFAEANAFLRRARDLDRLRFRADSAINGLIREQWSREGTNWMPVDAETPLIEDSPKQALGFPHFYEHVHFSFRANFLIAKEVAGTLLRHENLGTGILDSLQWTDAANALAYTPYDIWLILEEMERRFAQPPFTNIPGYDGLTAWMDSLRQALHERISKADEKARINKIYTDALRNRPEDDRIRINYANFLLAFGKTEAAFPLLKQAFNRNPTDTEAAVSWFTICLETNRLKEAADAIARIEHIFPEHPNLERFREQLK